MNHSRRQGLWRAARGAAVLALLALGAGGTWPQTESSRTRGGKMSQAIQAAREAVQQYDQGKDLAQLQKAGEKLEAVDLFGAPADERVALRQQVLAGWAAVLLRIDAARAPVDPDDQPVTRIFPKTPPGTRTYPANVDPKQIADPQVRAEYEQALQANQRKIEARQRYWDAKAIDIEVSEGARRFVRRFYTPAPADQKELLDILDRAGLTPERRQQLAGALKS